MGPSGGGGIGEGTGGPGDTATLLETTVIGTEFDFELSVVNVHRLDKSDGFCCSIPLLSFLMDPRRDGLRSKETVSKTAFWCPLVL